MGIASIIELVLGKLFIYFFLVVLTCTLVEIVLTTFHARSKVLTSWLMRIFDKQIVAGNGSSIPLGQAIMEHTLITGLARRGSSPTYISSMDFTSVLLEKISYDLENPRVIVKGINDIILAIEHTTVLSTEMQRILLGYAYEAKDAYESSLTKAASATALFRLKVEKWFDTSMGDLTGVFKMKYARPLTLLFSLLLSFLLNADSIRFATLLYTDSMQEKAALRPMPLTDSAYLNMMRRLGQMSLSTKSDSLLVQEVSFHITSVKKSADSFNAEQKDVSETAPIGWNNKGLMKQGTLNMLAVFEKIFGLLSTAMIVFVLSPFLFDIANKISSLRGTGPKPASTNDFSDSE